MIKVNNKEVKVEFFPDGTPRINLDTRVVEETLYDETGWVFVEWFYENNAEMMYLMMIKKHIDTYLSNVNYALGLCYVPNGRMDRVKKDKEVFTLKYFCDFINWLNFDIVYVTDPHSDVTPALLNNCMVGNARTYIFETLWRIDDKGIDEVVLYFPDAGASKRYSDLVPTYKYIYGNKVRDWDTGQITGIDIVNPFKVDLNGKTILMIDDIVSYGGSLKHSADKLKELGVGTIYAYATHTENSVLDREKGTLIKSLEDGTVERLFTTNTLFRGKHDRITIMEI